MKVVSSRSTDPFDGSHEVNIGPARVSSCCRGLAIAGTVTRSEFGLMDPIAACIGALTPDGAWSVGGARSRSPTETPFPPTGRAPARVRYQFANPPVSLVFGDSVPICSSACAHTPCRSVARLRSLDDLLLRSPAASTNINIDSTHPSFIQFDINIRISLPPVFELHLFEISLHIATCTLLYRVKLVIQPITDPLVVTCFIFNYVGRYYSRHSTG